MKEEISFVELLSILKKRLGMIIGLSLFGLLLSFGITFFMITPQYSSTTQMLANQTESSQSIQQSDINRNLQLINTYKDIIKGPFILDDVREELDLDLTHKELSNKIQILSHTSSQVFSLEVTDTNPDKAAEIANKTAEVFQEKIVKIMNIDNLSIISVAIPDTYAVSPNKVLNLAIGLLLGLMSAIGLAFALDFLDKTVKDTKFVTDVVGWVNLGSISLISENDLRLKEKVPKEKVPKEKVPKEKVPRGKSKSPGWRPGIRVEKDGI